MEEELKPCPYCGDAMPTVNRVGKCHAVECGCGMTGPYCDEPIEAISAWNSLPRRSDIERVERERKWLAKYIAGLKCPEIAQFVSCDFAPRGSTPKCIECWSKEAKEATHGV